MFLLLFVSLSLPLLISPLLLIFDCVMCVCVFFFLSLSPFLFSWSSNASSLVSSLSLSLSLSLSWSLSWSSIALSVSSLASYPNLSFVPCSTVREVTSMNRGRCLDRFCVLSWQYGVALCCVALCCVNVGLVRFLGVLLIETVGMIDYAMYIIELEQVFLSLKISIVCFMQSFSRDSDNTIDFEFRNLSDK